MRQEIKTLWRSHQDYDVYGLELVFATALLALRNISISYWLGMCLPPSDHPRYKARHIWPIDLYCIAQLGALLLLFVGAFGPIVDSWIVGYVLFDIYLNLLNIVFIGKFSDINQPPLSIERSILLLIVNVVGVVLAFGILYRDWLGLSTLKGFFSAILVFGTLGYPESSGNVVLLVALQIFLNILLLVVVVSSFVGQLGLFSNGKRR